MRHKSGFYAVGVTAIVLMVVFMPLSFAQDDPAQLKEQIEDLQNRIEVLEQEKTSPVQRQQWDDPFLQMGRMHEEMDRVFRDLFAQTLNADQGAFSTQMSFNPNYDIKEDKDGYRIVFDMAGLDKDKIDIQINASSITVKGEQNTDKKEQDKDKYFESRTYGSFIQTIPLPEGADTAKVKTEKQGDKLIITMPKKMLNRKEGNTRIR